MMDKKYKILLVEDDDMLADLFCEVLRKDGLECDVALSLSQAKDMISSSYDLLFTDFTLGDGFGYEICSIAEELFPHMRKIMITGHPDVNKDDYLLDFVLLRKPLELFDLLSQINIVLRRII